MQKLYKIKRVNIFAFFSFLLYSTSICVGAIEYLPYQTYAPGVFGNYSIDIFGAIFFPLIASAGVYLFPKKIEKPTDWVLIIFIIFLLIPGLTLGISSENIDIEKKFVVLPILFFILFLISASRNITLPYAARGTYGPLKNTILYFAIFGWVVLFLFLLLNFYSVMTFSGVDEIYYQRELTSDVGGIMGYAQLYFSFVFSTILIAYSLSTKKWLWFAIGSAGYFMMYLITAERSQLAFPVFLLSVSYLTEKKGNPLKIMSIATLAIAVVIFGVVYLSDEVKFFDLAGFYLFSRLIATPSQFILEYYDFFSTNGYTFFSQIKGFNILIDAPSIYASHPKWPQLGWIVGSGRHGIESNSNATFIAADGAASLGAAGMLLVTIILCLYLVFINDTSKKFPKPFWSTIVAQQALVLISGSLFSMLLSFGGLFYLLLFVFYKPLLSPQRKAHDLLLHK